MHITIENNLKLWVETFGDKGNEATLLISGAGAGCSFWSDRLCNTLADEGFFIIRYDHRDFGYSAKVDFDRNSYDMMDLSRDAIAILDSFDIEKANIVGHSMGGFIAQLVAIHFPERVISIISASSSTNSPEVPAPPEKTWAVFLKNKPVNNLKNDLDGFLEVWKYLNGTAEFDQEMAIEYTRKLYERQEINAPLGENHVKAQAGLTDRSGELKKLNIPALVIHGKEDNLVNPQGGVQCSECLRNSKLVLTPEMGHMLFNRDIQKGFEDEIIHFIQTQKQ